LELVSRGTDYGGPVLGRYGLEHLFGIARIAHPAPHPAAVKRAQVVCAPLCPVERYMALYNLCPKGHRQGRRYETLRVV
jgi:hypothetical protein